MDLYFIRILDQGKMKVGISHNAKKRIVNIQNAGGYPDNQISSNIFPDSGQFENTLKTLFQDYQIKGEWFEFKGLVEFFYNQVNFKRKIEINMIDSVPKKFLNTIDFNLVKERDKIERSKIKFKNNKALFQINSNIFNLSSEELEMIKNGDFVFLYNSSVEFFYGKVFVTWYFEDKRHIVKAFLSKLNLEFRTL